MKKRSPKWLIALAIPILIYFVWGYFGFAGIWIPGRYDKEKKEYKVFWLKTGLRCYNGYGRIKIYTPFKKHGLIDTTGKLVIPFIYNNLNDVKDNNLLVVGDIGKIGVITLQNKIIAQAEFNTVSFFYVGVIRLSKNINGKEFYGLIDDNGKEILPLEYSEITMPYNSRTPYFIASKGVYSYLIFPDGKVIKKDYLITNASFPNTTNHIKVCGVKTEDLDPNIWELGNSESRENPEDGNIYISIQNSNPIKQWEGMYDENGQEQLEVKYDIIDGLRYDGMTYLEPKIERIKLNGKWGLYNSGQNKWILPIKFQEMNGYINENLPLIKVRKSIAENYEYYDLKGNLILSANLEVTSFDDGDLLIFKKNGNRYRMEYNKEFQKFIWYKL